MSSLQKLGENARLGVPMSWWTMVGLAALSLPRTVLSDLGVIETDGSVLYFVLALGLYTVWLAVAVLRRTSRPLRDHLLAGVLYGLSLVIVHELLWSFETSQGQNPSQAAIDLAARFESPLSDLVIHLSEFIVAMMIGVGSGLVTAFIALVAARVRARRIS
ncbi:hypothetical protein [Brevibacterium oceani]|uniref:hypothetical protein n=1 Tax=Brevibacterium oceani TaxID=358099 RepID=UPI0015E76F76|nr:hypothetical protein [Brevibacterium oceani]